MNISKKLIQLLFEGEKVGRAYYDNEYILKDVVNTIIKNEFQSPKIDYDTVRVEFHKMKIVFRLKFSDILIECKIDKQGNVKEMDIF